MGSLKIISDVNYDDSHLLYSHSCTGDGSQWRAGCKLDEADLNELLCDNVNEFLHNKYSYVTQVLFR